jgi:hypothetical protein
MFAGEPKEKRPLGRPSRDEDNIKTELKEIGRRGLDSSGTG